TNTVKLKNRFWGFGFVGGMDTDWMLGQGLSLFGNADFSLLFGDFKVREKGSVFMLLANGTNGGGGFISDNDFKSGKGVFDIEMGLKWERCFEKYGRLSLQAGFEFHLYPNQNQWQDPNFGSATNLIPTVGDLAYQGLSFGAQLDF